MAKPIIVKAPASERTKANHVRRVARANKRLEKLSFRRFGRTMLLHKHQVLRPGEVLRPSGVKLRNMRWHVGDFLDYCHALADLGDVKTKAALAAFYANPPAPAQAA